jgi:adenylate cyclase
VSLIVVAALSVGIGVAAYATGLFKRSELQSVDARYGIRGGHRPPADIEFVQIDVPTFESLERAGLQGRFPFPRRYEAKVIEAIARGGAKAIAVDIEFTVRTDEQDDQALAEAVARAHGKVVLSTVTVGPHGQTSILGGNAVLRELGARPSEVQLLLDSDGSVRRVARELRELGSFATVAVETMTGKRVPRSDFEADGTVPTDYAGGPGTYHAISFAKVMKGEAPPGTFAGKLVIVGAQAPILQDQHATPYGALMPGPEIWANEAATLLEGSPLRFAPGFLDVLLIVLLGIAVPAGSLRVRRWRSLLDAAALAAVFSIAAQIAFNSGVIVTYVYPLLALVLGTLGTLLVLYVGEAIERERVRDVFSRFVPADLVEEVLAHAGEDLRLGGVERDCTVLFSDLRGFTSFSETQPAAKVIEVVNHYLNEMTEAILAEGGTLIAYMGDGIMAVFGTPLEQDDHADRAVRAARAMVGPRLERFNDWIASQGFDRRFKMGVGVNSGAVMAGNVGSERRVEYTAIGDTTNTASRLESMTKDSGTMVFISDTTYERLRTEAGGLERFGEVAIRGRDAKLAVWTIPGASGEGHTPPSERADSARAPEPAA